MYSLTGQEVTSGTVAAFLTILGYSMYDTVIVFDRMRENVPRMPRAAFSQIVNRSMSEVLTRSLITGLSTVFLVTVLLHLRRRDPEGLRLRDDGRGRVRRLLVDLHRLAGPHPLEGARARLPSAPGADHGGDGRVPTFPEDNVVARIDEVERRRRPRPRRRRRRPPSPAERGAPRAARGAAAVADRPMHASADGASRRPKRLSRWRPGDRRAEQAAPQPAARANASSRRRQQRRRRKHGRHS